VFYRALLLASSVMLVLIALLTAARSLGLLRRAGDVLAFTSERDGNAEIYVWDSVTGRLVNLSRNAATDFSPRWSIRDGWLAWVSDRDGNREIYLWKQNQIANISNHPEQDSYPLWAQDGRLAWVSSRDQPGETIYVWSGDASRRLAYVTPLRSLGWTANGNLIWESLDTSQVYWWDGHQIEFVSPNPHYMYQFWLPDGSLLWRRNYDDPPTYYRWNAGQTELIELPFAIGEEPYLSLSLQDKWAWSSGQAENWEVYVWDDVRQEAVNLSERPERDIVPQWSPDGRLAWIAFRGFQRDIALWDGTSTVYISADLTEDSYPVWSANGVLTWQSGGRDEREIMIWDGHSVRNISNYPGDDYAPNW
jgi:Tol biopolymer transport system component